MSRTIQTAELYIHPEASDQWSYRVRYSDGREESDTTDLATLNEDDDPKDELEAVVTTHGGEFLLGDVVYKPQDDGVFTWTPWAPLEEGL